VSTAAPTLRRAGLAAAALLAPAALALAWSRGTGEARQELLGRALYFAMPVVVALWVAAAVRRARGAPRRGWLRANALVLAAALAGTVATLVAVPPRMRMQFDETSLLATSQLMHAHRTAMMATVALPAPGGPAIVEGNLDKRPPLFPFAVSAVHDASGHRVANAFGVNGVLTFVLLALVGCRARRAAGTLAGVAAVPLLLAVPVLVGAATSAGFELLAATLLAATALAAVDFASTPTAARATWLATNALLCAQARYESLPVVLVLLALVAWRVRHWPRDGLGTAVLFAAPVLLAPLVLLALHSRAAHFYPEANGAPLLAASHLAAHAGPLLAAWFDIAAASAFAGWLAPLAVVGIALACATRQLGFALAAVAAPVVVATAIALAWFYGDVGEPTAVRLFLPAALLAPLGALLLLATARRTWLTVLLAAAAAVLAVRSVHAVRTEHALPPQHAAVALEAVDAALVGLAPDPATTLLVSTVAQYLIVRGFAAMSPNAFAARAARGAAPAPECVVLETPLDERLAAISGDPRALLAGNRATLLGRVPGELPVAAWRLQR
jgi:hypothetical protein